MKKRQHSLYQGCWAAVDPAAFEGSGLGLGSSAENWEPEASAVGSGLLHLQDAHSLVNEVLAKFPTKWKVCYYYNSHLNGTSINVTPATALHPAVIERSVH